MIINPGDENLRGFPAENCCIFLDLWYNIQKYVVRDPHGNDLGGLFMAEYKQYITQIQENGNVMISEDVVCTIAAQTLTEVEGVSGLNIKGGADLIEVVTKKLWGKSLKVQICEDNSLNVDCNILVAYGNAVVDVAAAVQQAVSGALESMTGVKVNCVNVNICGIVRK